jgi:multiple sugar transport system ATP-binding protein
MATIELQKVEKLFGTNHAVKPMDLTIADGEFLSLLGPSGCGKTTTLRMISGLESVTAGKILLNDKNVTWVHPSERDIAFVFQFYALYPHLNVRDNIAFPLRAEGEKKEVIDRRVDEVVAILRIEHLLKAKPGKLSGGDKQRVALARALVRRPAAFLMDEPLGALDAELREAMRAEIKQLHVAQNATTVYVTHDQVEAMALSDRIVVMSDAVVQQVGSPADVYYDPANLFVANFIGSPGMSLISGQLSDGRVQINGGKDTVIVPAGYKKILPAALNGKGDVIIGCRPESAILTDDGDIGGSVYAVDMYGSHKLLHIDVDNGDTTSIVHLRADRMVDFPIGSVVRFNIEPEMMRFFDPKTEQAIQQEVTQ